MVVGVNLPNGEFGVLEDDRLRLFDRVGNLVNDNAQITTDIIKRKSIYQAISILNSGGICEAITLSNNILNRYNCDSDIWLKLIEKQGFFKRLQLKGVESNVRYTQMIFIYQTGINIDNLLQECL